MPHCYHWDIWPHIAIIIRKLSSPRGNALHCRRAIASHSTRESVSGASVTLSFIVLWIHQPSLNILPEQQCRLAQSWPNVGTVVPTSGQRFHFYYYSEQQEKIIVHPREQKVTDHAIATFNCDTYLIPVPPIYWRRNGRRLTNQGAYKVSREYF